MEYTHDNVNNIISQLKELSNDDICIICDFDDTITQGIDEKGNKRSNSISVIKNEKILGEEYSRDSQENFDYYFHKEQDPNVSKEVKFKLMDEWWSKEYELYKKYKLTDNKLNRIIENDYLESKEECKEFFLLTKDHTIQTILFSAGNYNIIHKFLQSINCDYENIHVMSNILEFNDKDEFMGIKGDIIHSLNKNFKELQHLSIYSQVKNKKACIVIGDSLHDADMATSNDFEILLKIGFMNFVKGQNQYEVKLEAHRKAYDIVLEGNKDFSEINTLLKEILE